MKRSLSCVMVAVVLFVAIAGISAPAQAGTATDVALGSASFAVFNQLVGTFARPYYAAPVYAAAVVVAPPSPYALPPY